VSHCIAAHGGRLTRQYSAEGQGAKKDMSPPLEWYGVPEGTRSLALLVQDIDADPVLPWTHWVVANIPPTAKGLPEGFSGQEGGAAAPPGREYGGLQEGINDWKQPGWRGPVPRALPRPPHPVQALRARRRVAPRQQGRFVRACMRVRMFDAKILLGAC